MSVKRTSRDKLLDVTFEEVYCYGYNGAGTASILKKAAVPKGSMYHHFSSKKEMVLAMVEERLIPKVRKFFNIEMDKDSKALEILKYTMKKISKNNMLVLYGCPLHRLMFEMGTIDKEISEACEKEFYALSKNLERVVILGMKEGSIKKGDAAFMAEFILTSSWGFLSRPISSSSSKQFLQDSQLLLESIKTV